MLESLLQGAGFQVLGLAGAQELFDRLDLEGNGNGLSAIEVDAILMDLTMPEIDGISATRRLHGLALWRETPILVVTGRSENEDLQAAFEAGASDFIAKPPNTIELVARVSAAVRLKRAIDARREREAELQQLNSDLAAANQVKGQLLSIAAHDLKNPLQSVMGFAEVMQDMGLEGFAHDASQTIYQASQRMLSIIEGLLQNAKLESGKIELNRQPTDMSKLASLVVHDNLARAKHKGQNIVLEGQPFCVANIDGERLREVLDNLVSNAVKYSLAGSQITVRVWLKSLDPPIVALSVEDQGLGMSREDLERVFGQFQRLSARPTGGESSTGLGLAIVKQLVELHGGSVRAESAGIGLGSSFTIELPGVSL
jgi:two-component system, sensor histidine kinase and response regulator